VRKDGTCFWANVVIDAIRDEQGRLVGFAKITRDITERREAQIILQATQAQLAQSQKMEALGQLTGGVAHDFNNLLMVVSGNISTIKKAAPDNPKILRAAEAIALAGKRGESLTRQLLTFSRRQSLNPVVVSLHEAIEAIRTCWQAPSAHWSSWRPASRPISGPSKSIRTNWSWRSSISCSIPAMPCPRAATLLSRPPTGS
jgi:signal transduction histidine kinase